VKPTVFALHFDYGAAVDAAHYRSSDEFRQLGLVLRRNQDGRQAVVEAVVDDATLCCLR
jgi:hypothetical protein